MQIIKTRYFEIFRYYSGLNLFISKKFVLIISPGKRSALEAHLKRRDESLK